MKFKTSRELTLMSSPAQSPRYQMTIPAGTPVERLMLSPRRTDYVVAAEGFHMIKGSNAWDLAHYYVWIPNDAVENST